MAHYHTHRLHTRRTARSASRPFITFLLIASFGILFAGCTGPSGREPFDEVTFTEEDLSRARKLAHEAEVRESGSLMRTGSGPVILERSTGSVSGTPPALDLSQVEVYKAVRAAMTTEGGNLYTVTNDFVNIRTAPRVTAEQVGRLEQGRTLEVLEFVDAAWAKVKMPGGQEGYVSVRYIAKVTTEEKLAEEKKAFEGKYFVNFGFLNVRATADAQSEKIGELPGQAIIKPISLDNAWARISFQGREGYVSTQYLSPFMPNFIVRQNRYALPVLRYDAGVDGMIETLSAHVERLKADGYTLITFRDFRDLLLAQQDRDVRLEPRRAIVAVTGITPENMKKASDRLVAKNVPATIFIESQHLGLDGITEKEVLTLLANGFDLQSGGHTGDDLRALTNAQMELEMRQGRSLLEQYAHKPVFAIAYPTGGVNDRVATKAAEAAYLFGIGNTPGTSFTRQELLNIPSIVVTASMTSDQVMKAVSGG